MGGGEANSASILEPSKPELITFLFTGKVILLRINSHKNLFYS